MGVFNKINRRSGLIVVVIAVALLSFILSDLFFSDKSIFRTSVPDVGEINGTSITQTMYANAIQYKEAEVANLYSRNGDLDEGLRNQAKGFAWDMLVSDYAYKPEFEKLGITISEDEAADMVNGKFIYPMIKQFFGGQQNAANVNAEQINYYLRMLDSAGKKDPNDRFVIQWKLWQRRCTEAKLRDKYLDLFKKTEYVTTEEAKRFYNDQNDKAEIKFVYVPFYSINDSVVKAKLNDDLLEAYLNKNRKKYKVDEGRSLDYLVYSVKPSRLDSNTVKNKVAELVEKFRTTQNDSAFLTRQNAAAPSYKKANELPEDLKRLGANIKKDSVYGPILENGKYAVYKVMDVKTDPKDTVFFASVKHILFMTQGLDQAKKDSVKALASKVLSDLSAGADFNQMVQLYSGDPGSKSKNGEYLAFPKGQMVKPFEEAAFNSPVGLVRRLVETTYGYHILYVLEPKTNRQVLLGSVEKNIIPLADTKSDIYRKLQDITRQIKDTASLSEVVKKDPAFTRQSARNVVPNSPSLQGVTKGQQVLNWAYNEASVGDVKFFNLEDNQMVIAMLTGTRSKGEASIDDVRTEITPAVMNQLKGDEIIANLKKQGDLSKKDFQEIATAYGPTAVTNTGKDISFASGNIPGMGNEALALGYIFGLKEGQRSGIVKGENGVFIVEVVKVTKAAEVADYNQPKTQKQQQRMYQYNSYAQDAVIGFESSAPAQALKEAAEIVDERYKYVY